MSSLRLVRHIEDHAEEITDRIVGAIHAHTELRSYQRLAEPELRAHIRQLCRRLGEWLQQGTDLTVAHEFEALGRRRWREGVPLAEVLLVTKLWKEHLLGPVREEICGGDANDPQGGEELAFGLMPFFDRGTLELVRGYEAERFGKAAPPDALPSRGSASGASRSWLSFGRKKRLDAAGAAPRS
jgi:hypothetical protein